MDAKRALIAGITDQDGSYLAELLLDALLGDATKGRKKLGWAPKVQFPELMGMMVHADLDRDRALARP